MFDCYMMKTDLIRKFDTNWIEEFEKVDNQYEIFYNEDVTFVQLRYIYIDRHNTIQTIKEEKIILKKQNSLSREELIGILKKNCFHNDSRYTVLSILKYNLDLNPIDIKHFLTFNECQNYLSVVKNIDEIPFKKTITMFQDLNDIFILFYEKNSSLNQTKRVTFSSHKKTIRKPA